MTELGRAARLAAFTPPVPTPEAPAPLTNGIFVPLTPEAPVAGVPEATPATPRPTRLADLVDAIAQVAARQSFASAVAARTPEPGAAPGAQGGTPAPAFAPTSRILIDQRV